MAKTFKWTGRTTSGAIQTGEIAAESREAVIALLRRQSIIPTSISEIIPTKKAVRKRKKKITEKDLIVFTRQFSTMFTAGIPIVQALDILANQVENTTFREILSQIKNDVETGSPLADALRRFPNVFDDLYANLVAAGEAGGVLDTVLLRLSGYIEKSMKLKKKVKSAMVYPTIVLSVAALVIGVIMVWVIPIFSKIFGEMGVALPGPTRLVIAISNFLAGKGGLSILIILASAIFGLRKYRKTESGRKKTDAILLKAPLLGDILRKVAVARFTRTLGTLISSGVPILDGLDICSRSSGNKVVEEIIQNVKNDVSTGKPLAEPLSKTTIFPQMVVSMINVGESTGALDQMLTKIADFYDDEVDNAVANLTQMLEPMMMVILGTSIGFIIVSLYLPIFKMGEVVGK